MLKLPNVTLVAVETRAHELLRIAISDMLTKIEPADIHIHTDDPSKIKIPGAGYREVKDWPSMEHVWKYTYLEAFKPIKTDFALFIEWDTGITHPEVWSDEFFKYDYVGAPWWWTDGKNVGNGGFALRSRGLHDRIAKEKRSWTDNMICRDHRADYEKHGFKWAPDDLAHQFAHEWPAGDPFPSFGFHDSRNWVNRLTRDDILRRVSVMLKNLDNGPHYNFNTLVQQMPWLTTELPIPGYAASWDNLLSP